MSYITPNSDIWILKGIPLDESYTHTYYPWANGNDGTRTTQFNTFYSYMKNPATYRGKQYTFHLSGYSYLRKNRNSIRVKIPYDLLLDCNYIMFRNTAYGDKIFYAFIESIEYINDNTTSIKYVIDVMQTWHFDYNLNYCFVEREHSASDVRGENLLPEPVTIGEYVIGNQERIINKYCVDNQETGWSLVFACGSNPSVAGLVPASGYYNDGLWNQIEYRVFDADTNDVQQLREDIGNIVVALSIFGRQNTLINAYMCPSIFAPKDTRNWTPADDKIRTQSIRESRYYLTPLSMTPNYVDLSGNTWTPNNNKLYTYPYCFFTIQNQQGKVQTYKYEFFRGADQNRFFMFCENSVDPVVKIVPVSYMYDRGRLATEYNYDFSIDLKDFPKIGYAVNDFLAKVVQAGSALAIAAGTGHNPLEGSINAAKGAFENSIRRAADKKVKDIALEKYISKDADRTTDVSIDTISNLDTTNKIDYSALGQDFLKTVGSITGLLSMSNIQNSVSQGNINYVSDCFDFIAKEQHIDYRYAKIIDSFFDMYGYQTNAIKIPNRAVRPRWTFTKTTNCTVEGELPHEDAKMIQEIYNNGITFWKDMSLVGNYANAELNKPGQG